VGHSRPDRALARSRSRALGQRQFGRDRPIFQSPLGSPRNAK
jgi:hypothetical protein